MYNTKLLNKFYEALFSTDFNDFETATQNMKTDCLETCTDFDSWLNKLVETFAEEYDVDKEQVMKVTFDGAESEEGEQVFTLPDQLDELLEKVHNYAVHNCDFYVNGKSYLGL